jgi:hypothetical protein
MPNDANRIADPPTRSERRWLVPAAVVTGCLVGCVLPIVAYAEAMSAFFGFGAVPRRWAGVLIAVPTVAWCAFALHGSTEAGSLVGQLAGAGMLLGGQFVMAVGVAAGLSHAIAQRRRTRGEGEE